MKHLPYVSGPKAISQAHERFGGPQGLLRSAAGAVEQAGANDRGESSSVAGDHEVEALRRFALDAGVMLEAEVVRTFITANAMRGGKEHKVARFLSQDRVLKDLDAHATATESLFDYLTDIQLANHFFGDDIRLEGFYEHEARLHVVTSQPFIHGIHADWDTLKSALEGQGLRHDSPKSRIPSFLIDGGEAGNVLVIDLHENNVVFGSATGLPHPIDAHFYFDDRFVRDSALIALGLK